MRLEKYNMNSMLTILFKLQGELHDAETHRGLLQPPISSISHTDEQDPMAVQVGVFTSVLLP